MSDKAVNGERTLLEQLHEFGIDNGADFDDGINGYFSWTVESDVLTVIWRPYDFYSTDSPHGIELPVSEQKWRLVPL